MAAGVVDTIPFCGACGYPQVTSPNGQDANDVYCNSCGSDVTFYGFEGFRAPVDLVATAGSLEVVFTFTANPEADSTDIWTRINEEEPVEQLGATSPVTIVAAEGDTVYGVVRSVKDGIPGNWGPLAFAVALA